MRSSAATILLGIFIALNTQVSAHGRITNITAAGNVVYPGFDPAITSSTSLTAWSASNLGNIFVKPSDFNTSHIACHYNATPGAVHITTTPNSTLKLQWNEWPLSHKGPVITYLAACEGSCAKASAKSLEWVKIDELGWVNGTDGWGMGLGGTWASDILIANGASWMVRIPDGLASGDYVLRHEIIALHVAEELNGAQAYPQCVNLKVENNGPGAIKTIEGGVIGSELYGMRDRGVLVDIHGNVTRYEIPGPMTWKDATRFKQPNEA